MHEVWPSTTWPHFPDSLTNSDIDRVCAALNAAPKRTLAAAQACLLLIGDVAAGKSLEQAFVHTVHLLDALDLPRLHYAGNPPARVGSWGLDVPMLDQYMLNRVASYCYLWLTVFLRDRCDADSIQAAILAEAECARLCTKADKLMVRTMRALGRRRVKQ